MDRQIEGPHGQITARVYQSAASGTAGPGLVWVHGGAFAFGDIDMPEAHWVSEQLAARGIAVVSVSYQLAPDFDRWGPPPLQSPGVHFPVASDEIVPAFEWGMTDATELGIDPRLLSIGGASAGANLAAGASLRIRDASGSLPGWPLRRWWAANTLATLPDRGGAPSSACSAQSRPGGRVCSWLGTGQR